MPKVLIETQYFPTIAFFALLLESDSLILDAHENYHKGSYRNRAYIQSSQGPLALSIPLKGGKNNQMNIRDVTIDYSDNWQVNHQRSIEACYGKSPYFEYYIHEFMSMFASEEPKLFDLNLMILKKCAAILGVETRIELSDRFITSSEGNIDLKRDFISPKIRDQERLGAYFRFPEYDQVFSDERAFAPNLSILDLIFCLGPEARLYLARMIKE